MTEMVLFFAVMDCEELHVNGTVEKDKQKKRSELHFLKNQRLMATYDTHQEPGWQIGDMNWNHIWTYNLVNFWLWVMEEWIKLSHFPLLLPSNIIYNPAKKWRKNEVKTEFSDL